jgi:putative heme-binding domain-containing protein
LSADVAKIGVRSVRISGRPDAGLLDALTKAGGLTFGAKALTPAELKDLVTEVTDKGDAERGEKVFRRQDQLCLKCHAIGGAGGQVGPDLSSIGTVAQVDYLIESLLMPSKAIKENYHAVLVTTTKGKQYTGIKVGQTKNTLILRNDHDQELAIPTKDIEEQSASKVSLMPDGLTDTLTRGELVDLVRFLSGLGKTERWSVGKDKVARRWQVVVPDRALEQLFGSKTINALAGDEAGILWEPVYGTVTGALPLDGLARFRTAKSEPEYSVLRTQLAATTGAKIRLKVNTTKGLTAWLNGEPMTLSDATAVALKAGLHTLTLAVRHDQRKEAVRLEVEDTAAAAGVRFVGGK